MMLSLVKQTHVYQEHFDLMKVWDTWIREHNCGPFDQKTWASNTKFLKDNDDPKLRVPIWAMIVDLNDIWSPPDNVEINHIVKYEYLRFTMWAAQGSLILEYHPDGNVARTRSTNYLIAEVHDTTLAVQFKLSDE